jgi:phosphate transport system protein
MSTKKEQSIQDIMNSFSDMADIVLEQLSLVELLMSETDNTVLEDLVRKIRTNEIEIDKFEISISDKFINAIVLYQPMASDIRRLVAISRMSINLERIGDQVMNIAYIIENLKEAPEYLSMAPLLLNMLLSGKIMVEKSLLSFVNSDPDYAIWTIKNDSVIDEMNQKLLTNSISKANVDKKTKTMLLSYVELKSIITNIERIADHATNIAEATIYSLQGTDVRHSGFDKESDAPSKKEK